MSFIMCGGHFIFCGHNIKQWDTLENNTFLSNLKEIINYILLYGTASW